MSPGTNDTQNDTSLYISYLLLSAAADTLEILGRSYDAPNAFVLARDIRSLLNWVGDMYTASLARSYTEAPKFY